MQHDGINSTGVCFDIAAAHVHLEFLHVSTSLYPLLQSIVLLLSALVLFTRLTAAYRAAFRKTQGNLRKRLLQQPESMAPDMMSLSTPPLSTSSRGTASAAELGSAPSPAPPEPLSHFSYDSSAEGLRAPNYAAVGADAPLLNPPISSHSDGRGPQTPSRVAGGRRGGRGRAVWNTLATRGRSFFRRAKQRDQRSLNSLHHMVMPMYYTFSQLLCLLFFLQIVVYLPGNTLAVSLLRYGSFAVSAAFDNFMVAFLVTRRKWVAFVASMVLATLYGVFAAIVIPLAPCKWCDYYVSQIPATRMIEFPYLAFGCAYLLLALCARYQWSFRWFPTPRPALQGWAGMLAISYIFGGGGMMILNTTPIDLGFCLVDFGVLWYTLAYVPLLYKTMISDTAYCNQQQYMHVLAGMREDTHGTHGKSVDPTVDQLQQLLADPSVNIIPYEDIEVLGVLGAGASGHVYSGTWRGAPVAVKQLGGSVLKTSEWGSGVSTQGRKRLLSVNEKTNAGPASEAARTAMLAMVRRLVKEAAILSTLRHPNIVCLYGLVVDSRHHALITEIVPGMNLFALLHPATGKVTPTWRAKLGYLAQCAAGMSFLHESSPQVLHRDLKSGNVLIRRRDGMAKVCDFGLSVHRQGTLAGERVRSSQAHQPQVHALGTCQWTAPEVLCEKPHSYAADVWSFGVMIWECCSVKPPFHNMSAMRVAAQVAYMHLRLPLPDSMTVEQAVASDAAFISRIMASRHRKTHEEEDDDDDEKDEVTPAAASGPDSTELPHRPGRDGASAEPGQGDEDVVVHVSGAEEQKAAPASAATTAGSPSPDTPDLAQGLSECPQPLRDIMEACFAEEPTMRPKFRVLLRQLRAVLADFDAASDLHRERA